MIRVSACFTDRMRIELNWGGRGGASKTKQAHRSSSETLNVLSCFVHRLC